MTIKFTPPMSVEKAPERQQLSVTTETHDTIKQLSVKHGVSMTKMAHAIVSYHVKTNEV